MALPEGRKTLQEGEGGSSLPAFSGAPRGSRGAPFSHGLQQAPPTEGCQSAPGQCGRGQNAAAPTRAMQQPAWGSQASVLVRKIAKASNKHGKKKTKQNNQTPHCWPVSQRMPEFSLNKARRTAGGRRREAAEDRAKVLASICPSDPGCSGPWPCPSLSQAQGAPGAGPQAWPRQFPQSP